jgi:hypothetical protein
MEERTLACVPGRGIWEDRGKERGSEREERGSEREKELCKERRKGTDGVKLMEEGRKSQLSPSGIYMHIHMYQEREREREREGNIAFANWTARLEQDDVNIFFF